MSSLSHLLLLFYSLFTKYLKLNILASSVTSPFFLTSPVSLHPGVSPAHCCCPHQASTVKLMDSPPPGCKPLPHQASPEFSPVTTLMNLSTGPHCLQNKIKFSEVQILKSVSQSVQLLSRVRLCNPMDCSTPGLPVHHQLPEFTQIHVH